MTPEAKAYHAGMIEGEKLGERSGAVKERANLLAFLENKYLHKEIKRGTPEGDAILQVARDLGQHFRDNPLGDGA